MKKNLFLLVTATLLFAACQKDGVYNPKEKIASITTNYTFTMTYPDFPELNNTDMDEQWTEQWTWDKKLLKHIDAGDGYFLDFQYDGKQIQKIVTHDGYYQYTYKDKKVDKVEYFEGTELVGTISYQYEGKKVSTITNTYSFEGNNDILSKKKAQIQKKALSFMLPNSLIKESHQHSAKLAKKIGMGAKELVQVVSKTTLTWDGDNVSKMTTTTQYGSAGIAFTEITEFTYDNKNNPYYHAFDVIEESEYNTNLSKNNVTKIKITSIDSEYPDFFAQEEYNYTYKYDSSNFPTSIIQSNEWVDPEAIEDDDTYYPGIYKEEMKSTISYK
ncbi:MAG: hypothetical protein LBV46_03410 [Bacteroidales bacterium]|jgi:hypothetical protein|nr:hypothetical protein [Bacteroidales bacterium]